MFQSVSVSIQVRSYESVLVKLNKGDLLLQGSQLRINRHRILHNVFHVGQVGEVRNTFRGISGTIVWGNKYFGVA